MPYFDYIHIPYASPTMLSLIGELPFLLPMFLKVVSIPIVPGLHKPLNFSDHPFGKHSIYKLHSSSMLVVKLMCITCIYLHPLILNIFQSEFVTFFPNLFLLHSFAQIEASSVTQLFKPENRDIFDWSTFLALT